MSKPFALAAGVLAAAGALAVTLPAAVAEQVAAHPAACFRVSQIENTTMPDTHTLLIRTSATRIYRMSFAGECNNMGTEPLIIHPVDNSGTICGAIGVDVSVRETHQLCNPSDLVQLSPDEVAAIPKKDLP